MARPRPAAEADGQRRLAVVDGDQAGALIRDGLDVGDLALAEPADGADQYVHVIPAEAKRRAGT